ncbi:MAG: nuclear transport factor 2 family protein [Chloroflexi bacterium]|nr:nuclear transport factor 2 family protein [Chloroflexota bacterium]
MMKITVNEDCGNAPKKLFLKDFNIAFAERDIDFVADSVTDDISWDIVGDKTVQGKHDFLETLEQTRREQISEQIISKIITHGKEGAVSGMRTLQNGKHYAFCDIYEFSGARGTQIKTITSYVIKVRESGKS